MKRGIQGKDGKAVRVSDAKRTPPTPVWFPAEIWGEIASHCDPTTWSRLARLCKGIAGVLSQPFYVDAAMKRFSKTLRWDGIGGVRLVRTELPSGLPHGLQEILHQDGTPQLRWMMNKGKGCGLCEMYFDDGTLRSRAHFLDGEKHGTEVVYFDDGKTVRSTTEWAHDQKCGQEEEFFDTGERCSLQHWVAGRKCGDEVWFHKDGTVRQVRNHQFFPAN